MIVGGLCGTVAAQTTGGGPTPPSPVAPPGDFDHALPWDRISPTIDWLARIATDGVDDPAFGELDGSRGTDLLVRLSCPPGRATFEGLRSSGLEFADRGPIPPRPVGGGDVYAARIDWRALDRLAANPCIERAEPARLPGRLQPLRQTTERIGARAAHYRPSGQVDGKGTTIALLDSPVDILHPAFFQPDGGRFDWIDVDGDGEFESGVDAIDLDGDGRAESNETARLLEATTLREDNDRHLTNADGTYQTDRDWLYVDMNADQQRNAGPEAGFSESDPGYGEPLFVVDDVDRDRRLEPDEALYRLDSSKIERLVLDEQTFIRGENLIEAAGLELPERATHGTAVAGVLVGGQLGFHKRVGVAPRADLVVFGGKRQLRADQTDHLEALDQAQSLGADVFLSEWTNPFLRPLDGSTNLESAMRRARQDDLLQVVPVGNLNRSQKHILRKIPPSTSVDLDFQVPSSISVGEGPRRVDQIFGTLQWQGSADLTVDLQTPSGPAKTVAPGGTTTLQGVEIETALDRTPGGTAMLSFFIRSTGKSDEMTALPVGDWRFTLGGVDTETTVAGRITDPHTGWNWGVRWREPTEDRMTVSFPATTPAVVGVAAYTGRSPTASDFAAVGDLRLFSGRGPNLLGESVVDIAAPDNPFVPLAATPEVRRASWGPAWFRMFGGTSGAAPHVAGGLALLRESAPAAAPAALESRLFDRAGRREIEVDLPSPGWGHGRLQLHRALYDEPPADNRPPTATLTLRRTDKEIVFDGTASSDPDGDRLSYRFDLDHDGRWDTEWLDEGLIRRPINPASGRRLTRLEVRDSAGARHGALARFEPADPEADTGPTADVLLRDTGADTGNGPAAGPERPPGCTCAPVTGRISPLFHLLGVLSLIGWRRRRTRTQ